MAVILMFFGIGIIGVLSSYLAATFLTLERRRRESIAGARGKDKEGDDDEEPDRDDPTKLEAELAAIKQLLEQRSQAQ